MSISIVLIFTICIVTFQVIFYILFLSTLSLMNRRGMAMVSVRSTNFDYSHSISLLKLQLYRKPTNSFSSSRFLSLSTISFSSLQFFPAFGPTPSSCLLLFSGSLRQHLPVRLPVLDLSSHSGLLASEEATCFHGSTLSENIHLSISLFWL